MFTKREHIRVLDQLIWLSGYLGCRNLREHWRLQELFVFFLGATDYYAFEAEGIRLWRSMDAPSTPPFTHVLGGSSYGAFFSRREAHATVTTLARALGIPCAMIGFHFGQDGRFDFHIAAPNYTEGGIPLSHRDILAMARRIMRRLINGINRQRLRDKRYLAANFTVDGEVVYDLVDLEQERKRRSTAAEGGSPPAIQLSTPTPAPAMARVSPPRQNATTTIPPDLLWEQRIQWLALCAPAGEREDEEQARRRKEARDLCAQNCRLWMAQAKSVCRRAKKSTRTPLLHSASAAEFIIVQLAWRAIEHELELEREREERRIPRGGERT